MAGGLAAVKAIVPNGHSSRARSGEFCWLAAAASAKMHAPRMNTRIAIALTLLVVSNAFAAGKQLTGAHAPAATPALAPLEAEKKFVVPDGFAVRLFAAEPDVINPVAMTWDERGRLWVLELYEYPLGAPPGQKGRDRIRILEDADNDGRADKVTVFADGLNLATGLLLGNGGVYVGQAPHLLFLQDTNHDDQADTQKVLLTGFGLEDRHELLNGFTWGPDGWLYMTHGVFTRSKVKIPEATEPGVEMTAAVARFHPRSKKFEIFAEGTSNPWGVDFDATGNAFVSACVIDHLFHMAPGGTYQRQSGSPSNPYAYEILPSIVEHKHHMAAYCGICIYQGDQFPPEYQGRVFMGNIHQNAINHDRLITNGASFKAVAEPDFLTTKDGWFMPVSEQVGPDGALWIADWYDKYPCYQNANADPEGVDRERGRIWRVVYVGKEAGKKIPSRPEVKMDLGKLTGTELLAQLRGSNIWHQRMAQRLLRENLFTPRRRPRFPDNEPGFSLAFMNTVDGNVSLTTRLYALWLLEEYGDKYPRWLLWSASTRYPDDWLRRSMAAWRVAAEGDATSEQGIQELELLARDPDPRVQFAVATALRRIVSSRLVTNFEINDTAPVEKALATLIRSAASGQDRLVNYMIWLASEPLFARNPEPGLRWLAENGAACRPLTDKLTAKAMRRLCDLGGADKVDRAVSFIGELASKDDPLTVAALEGLLEAQKGKAVRPTVDPKSFLEKLAGSASTEVQLLAQRLGTVWGSAAALEKSLTVVGDSKAPVTARIEAIQAVALAKTDAVRAALLAVLASGNPEAVTLEALRALSAVGGDDVGAEILKQWPRLTTAERRAASDVLSSRRRWLLPLLAAIETKQVAPVELSMSAVRALAEANDEGIRQRAAQAIGRIRPANADKQKLIATKKEMILAGKADLAAGHEVAKKTCFVCHKLNGEGGEVGPDLTGVGRSSLDALLANVIDPNQIVGKGYENVVIETKDERSVSGRLIEETPTQVKLLASGPKEEIVARSDIATMKISELSVMPEGLEQMPDADFRNLIQFILTAPGEAKK